ncbi:MAG: fibro-slime domain-containing protein [Polyangiaceae bacterium]
MSARSLYVLALPLGLIQLAFVGCSASGTTSSTSSHTGAGGAGDVIVNNGTGGGLVLMNGGNGNGAGGDSCGQVLPVTYRDFKGSNEPGGHQDFEASGRNVKNSDGTIFKGWNEIGCGLVMPTLGTDGKPVAFTGMPDVMNGTQVPLGVGQQQRAVSGVGCWTAANPNPTGVCGVGTCAPWTITPPTWSIQSGSTFAQWYTTTAGVNMEIPGELMLTETPAGSGVSVYDSTAFFPIDGQGFGNTPGQAHNYSFTTEIHVKFQYQAGQKFTFRGDDDLWIYVNNKLALDVGGQHQALEGTINFDAQAVSLGITVGSTYAMDIFHAERQTTDSNFRIETNIRCFEPVVVK